MAAKKKQNAKAKQQQQILILLVLGLGLVVALFVYPGLLTGGIGGGTTTTTTPPANPVAAAPPVSEEQARQQQVAAAASEAVQGERDRNELPTMFVPPTIHEGFEDPFIRFNDDDTEEAVRAPFEILLISETPSGESRVTLTEVGSGRRYRLSEGEQILEAADGRRYTVLEIDPIARTVRLEDDQTPLPQRYDIVED